MATNKAGSSSSADHRKTQVPYLLPEASYGFDFYSKPYHVCTSVPHIYSSPCLTVKRRQFILFTILHYQNITKTLPTCLNEETVPMDKIHPGAAMGGIVTVNVGVDVDADRIPVLLATQT
jgi:hypothetical protein